MATPPLPLEAEEFLSWMLAEKGRSANTLAAYRRDLRSYCAWLGEHATEVLDVDHETLVTFVGERKASDSATSSVARQLAAIRM
jgi:integrase/recombinase XerD